MHLTSEQEKILQGEQGEAKRLAMQLVTRVGDVYGADRLVPIASAHILAHYGSLHEAGIALYDKLVSEGARFAVPTTVNPASIDLERWREFGFPRRYVRKQLRLCRAYAQMGGIPSWSCIHYQYCNVPRYGQALAWCESSAVCYANSVIGARTNRLTAGLDLACAILGMTPRFGLLLPENRRGQILVRLATTLEDDLDYQTLGYLIGKSVGNKIPVIEGLPHDSTVDQLQGLSAAAASGGSVAMFHAVGITPDAPSLEQAFGGEMPTDRLTIGREELKSAAEDLNISPGKPDLVALGGPQYSMAELLKVAQLLAGKKVRRGVKLWIYTSRHFAELCSTMGFAAEFKKAGAELSTSTCAEIQPLEDLGIDCMLTCSAKYAHSIAADHKIGVGYATLKECIQAACTM